MYYLFPIYPNYCQLCFCLLFILCFLCWSRLCWKLCLSSVRKTTLYLQVCVCKNETIHEFNVCDVCVYSNVYTRSYTCTSYSCFPIGLWYHDLLFPSMSVMRKRGQHLFRTHFKLGRLTTWLCLKIKELKISIDFELHSTMLIHHHCMV